MKTTYDIDDIGPLHIEELKSLLRSHRGPFAVKFDGGRLSILDGRRFIIGRLGNLSLDDFHRAVSEVTGVAEIR